MLISFCLALWILLTAIWLVSYWCRADVAHIHQPTSLEIISERGAIQTTTYNWLTPPKRLAKNQTVWNFERLHADDPGMLSDNNRAHYEYGPISLAG